MSPSTPVRAVWITDEAYLGLTLLSMSSLLDQVQVPVTIIFTEEEDAPRHREWFEGRHPDLEWLHWRPATVPGPPRLSPVVVNRLARIHALRRYPDEIVMLLDSDTAFSGGLNPALEQLERGCALLSPGEASVFGVVEHRRAWDAGLFFAPSAKTDWHSPQSDGAKHEVLRDVFGEPCERLQEFPQYNNGILAFRRGDLLADCWEEFYLRTVSHPQANLLDDQLPLAVAMHDLDIPFRELPAGWNSLGRANGPYFGWHPWAGKWKTDLLILFGGRKAVSDFGKVMERHLDRLDDALHDRLREMVLGSPSLYQAMPGPFPYMDAFDFFVENARGGESVLEVGRYFGPSTIYLAELIRKSGKDIDFTSFREFPSDDWDKEILLTQLELAELDDQVTVREGNPIESARGWEDECMDLICCDHNPAPEDLRAELEILYRKLKPGGVMVGFDESIYETFGDGLQSVSLEFCREHNVSCSCDGQIFYLQKPLEANN